jgi:hypothetical protein
MKTILNLKTGESYPYISYTFLQTEKKQAGPGETEVIESNFWILETENPIPFGLGHLTYEIEGGERIVFRISKDMGMNRYLTVRTI